MPRLAYVSFARLGLWRCAMFSQGLRPELHSFAAWRLVWDGHRTRRNGSSLHFGFGTVTHGYQEDGALAFGMRGEEGGYVVVEKCQAGGA